MALEKVLLSTALGDAITGESDRVYVKVHSNQFIRKEARDVEEGETVLWYTNKTGTRFKDIEPYLTSSPRYKHALKFIQEENEQGEYIPKLRAFLIRGMSNQGVISSVNLEDKILRNQKGSGQSMDFEKSEIEKMRDYLVEFMSREGSSISPTQAHNWLVGETVAPLNWDHFRTLEKLNSEFKAWEKRKQERDSIYFNYRLYVVTRQQIDRRLGKYLGRAIKGEGEDFETFITVNPEYNIIINHFLDEHSDVIRDPDTFDELVFARVNARSRIRKRSQEAAVRKANAHLTDGVFVKGHPQLDVTAMPYSDVIEHKHVIDHVLGELISRCLAEPSFRVPFRREEVKDFGSRHGVVEFYLMNKFKEEYGKTSDADPAFAPFIEIMREASGSDLKPFDGLYEDWKSFLIKGGEVEIGLDHGTFLRSLEIAFKLDLGIPYDIKRSQHDVTTTRAELFKLTKQKGEVDARALSRMRRVLRNRKKLGERFDIDLGHTEFSLSPAVFFSEIVSNAPRMKASNKIIEKIERQDLSVGGYLEDIANDPESLREFYSSETIYPPRTLIFTRGKTLSILDRYQLPDLLRLIERDFCYERFLKSGETPLSQWGELDQTFGLSFLKEIV